MFNLEHLSLYFLNLNGPIIDGNELEKNVVNHMTRLNKFTFNIRSIVLLHEQTNIPSNEDIRYTFRNFQKNQIISCADYFSKADEYHCHIYSYPYTLTYYRNITNNFPGGIFKCVSEISLFDERPFEHEFFLQIAQSFSFIKKFILHNRESPKNENQQWSIIEYSHLTQLDLVRVHENYVEQFLLNTKMSFRNDVYLYVAYDSLQRVTNNFTRDATRINCSKINYLLLFNKPELSCDLRDYFPHAKIL